MGQNSQSEESEPWNEKQASYQSFVSILERIHEVSETRTQAELATFLDVKQSSVSDAKKRRRIPDTWLLKCFERLGVNPFWLRTGEGPVYAAFRQSSCRPTAHCLEHFPTPDLAGELLRRYLPATLIEALGQGLDSRKLTHPFSLHVLLRDLFPGDLADQAIEQLDMDRLLADMRKAGVGGEDDTPS